jgi:DNA-binding MarR family transcriptional regulator
MHSIFCLYLWLKENFPMKDQTIDYIIKSTWQAIARMYNEEATKYGATMATGYTLLSIDKENGTPSTSLGPKMGMEATSLTRTLKMLEDRELIRKKKNPSDGRGVLLYLTDEGKEKRELSKNTVLQFNDTIKKNTTEEQLKNFVEVAEIINQLIADKKIFKDK